MFGWFGSNDNNGEEVEKVEVGENAVADVKEALDQVVVSDNAQETTDGESRDVTTDVADQSTSAGTADSKPGLRDSPIIVEHEGTTPILESASPEAKPVEQANENEQWAEEVEPINSLGNLEDEIDLDLVERFDNTFNDFITTHPEYLVANPDLVHSLRVSKLQTFLERSDHVEDELTEQLETLQASKAEVEADLYLKLMNASRMKAAREVHLQSKLSELQVHNRELDAKLQWKLITSSESRAKKHYKMRQQFKNSVVGTDRLSLLEELPEGIDFQSIRDAVLAPPSREPLSAEQENDRRQFQVDNAFLKTEVQVLRRTLENQKIAAKKNAWVESVLVRMDPKTLNKLKAKHTKKSGVSL